MTLRLENKLAVVTGGGSGIGQATAIRFAKEGARVFLLDRTVEKAEETKQIIEKNGGRADVVECDISEPKMVERAMKEVADLAGGKVDIVFANAGVNGKLAPIETMEVEDWDQTMCINMRGTFATVKYAIPHMKDNGGSIIINSSINGNRVFSNIGFSAYASTKAGQAAFMKMAALELARYKIRVNSVHPGAIDTEIDGKTTRSEDLEEVQIPVEYPEGGHPLAGEAGKPEQVANLVLFLASDEASHVSGTEVYVDGAESLLRG
ncbi:SDR family oxidoreductase [Paenibacillus sp. An7]|uniref:SDR family oxidoreductase n=1 Tax=Paenibacillus sp. An7 TaxID=2689577 RepID=UPI001357BDF0|nr:SDR family NAD(P)-dependent oxidoreductase [Paenibacillus sp. An7]